MLVLGVSPMVGSRQFGDRSAAYLEAFARAGAREAVWSAFADAGGLRVHLVDEPTVWAAFLGWSRAHGHPLRAYLTLRDATDGQALAELAEVGGVALLDARAIDRGADGGTFARRALAEGLGAGCVSNDPAFRPPEPLAGAFARPLSAKVSVDGFDAPLEGPGVIAMLTLAAGDLAFPGGLLYAARRSEHQMVGCSSPDQAARLAASADMVPVVAAPAGTVLRAVVPSDVDVAATATDVTFLRDHDAMRLADGARQVWGLLQEPSSIDGLVVTVAARSGRPAPLVEVDVLGLVARLHAWRLVELEPPRA
jgi:hypothetical protein